MTKIEMEYLDVPRDFRIACESFGIVVPDFLQLIIRHCAFIHLFMHDDSEYDMATKAFVHAEKYLEGQPGVMTNYSLSKYSDEVVSLLKKLMKLVVNRSYSAKRKRDKAIKITDKLFNISSRELDVKSYVYYDEETKITFSRNFMLMTLIHQYPPIALLNALMQCVSLADLYARMHLGKEVPNPALAFYLSVQNGYGGLVDRRHINTLGFKDFFMDLQEFKTRYFIFQRLEQRIEVYRDRFEENFQKINNI